MYSDSSGRPPRLGGTIVLQARPDSPPFQVEKNEADDPRIGFVEGPDPGGRMYRIGVTWTDPEAKGVHQGTIRIVTDSPTMPEIEIPYQVRIQ